MLLSREEEPGWGLPGAAGFAVACVALVLAFDGPWLFSDRVGGLDWPKELFYFHTLRASLVEFGSIPVSFFTIPESLRNFSTLQDLSYWSNPEVVSLSPFLPLLWLMPTVWFIKAYFGLHFALGVAGTGLLARRLGFSPLEGVCLFLLLALNPWLTQHLAIGYSPYINFLLFPGVAALLLAPGRSPFQTALAALGCAMAFYQGALHLFVWFNLGALAVGTLACFRAGSFGPLGRVIWMQVLTFVLIFPKYTAVQYAYADFLREPGTGYGSWAALWGLLTDTTSPLFDFPAVYSRYGVAFYDASLGVGAWFVILSGLALFAWPFLPGREGRRPAPAWIPALCCVLFLTLGWGGNWHALTRLVPPLASEIYPFRWLFPAYLFAAVFLMAVLSRASRLTAHPARAVLFALLLPCALAFHQRNAVFAEVMGQEEDIFAGFTLKEYVRERVVALSGETRLPATFTPNGLTVVPPGSAGDPVQLPWLEPWRLCEYGFENMQPDVYQPETSSVMIVTREMSPVRVVARTHSRAGLGAASACVFLALVAVSMRFGRGQARAVGRLEL